MTPPNFPPSPVARACAAAVLGTALASAAPAVLAATAAGQEIKNVATVTYQDAAGNTYTSDSNEAVVTVAQVYAATIGVDKDRQAAPGETVYFDYVLTNTGNGSDGFRVAVADGATGSSLASASRTVYRDTNGNGLPDAGEPELGATDTITLDGSVPADASVDLVVAVQMPATATAAEIAGITLTATAENGTTGTFTTTNVDDLSPSNGRDGNEATVESRITITEDAVLNLSKSSVHDTANGEITYTISVTNTGNTPAQDVVLFDGIPAGTSIARVGGVPTGAPRVSATGVLTGNGDTEVAYVAALEESTGINFNLDGDVDDDTETSIGLDLNSDGDTGDGGAGNEVPGVFLRDDELAPNATITMTFTVAYDGNALGGGAEIANVAHLVADTNNSGTLTGADTRNSSTRASDTVPTRHGVEIDDTDTPDDDSQRVASVASGGTVDFVVEVTNDGNADDSFELTIDQDASDTFPVGTVFSFLDQAGTVTLIDANGQGGIDTGVIAAGASRTIVVRANLPQGVAGDNGGAGYQANVRVVSAEDPSVVASAAPASTASIDLVELDLDQIVAASADIHASAGGTDGGNENPLVTSPFTAAATTTANAGTSVDIPFFIDNESDLLDSYALSVGSSLDAGVIGALPDGWSVQFFLTDDPNGDGSGTLARTGGAISSVSVPANRLDFPVIARVTIPGSAAQAAADVDYDIDANATTNDTLDGNGDGDGDYPLFLRILSSTSGATDTLLEAVDVIANRAVSFNPGTSNQVELGGTVDYPLTLGNDGNSTETLELTSSNTGTGFGHTIRIDTNGDGTPDTALGNLLDTGAAGNPPVAATIQVRLANGTVATITVRNTDNDAFPELVIPAGIDLPLLATVLAPSSATGSDQDTLTLVATNVDGTGPSTSVSATTDVVNGAVRVVKTVAVDANCNGDIGDAGDSGFAETQTARVEPGQCALWRIVAENQGSANALDVFVTDAVTPFSDFLGSSLRGCIGNGCAPTTLPVTDGVVADTGATLPTIRFNLGTGASATAGGTLIPGQKATMQFGVTVR